ncbi:MAG: hypothetical protein WCS42_09480 [Verrucomicrobiota bacterium]
MQTQAGLLFAVASALGLDLPRRNNEGGGKWQSENISTCPQKIENRINTNFYAVD